MWIPIFLVVLALVATSNAQDSSDCAMACPPGWDTWGFSEHCYRLPPQPAKLETFGYHQKMCKEMEPTSYIIVVNSIAEQAAGTVISFQYAPNWFGLAGNGFMWIGGYTDENGWKFTDGTDQTSNPLFIAAGVIGSTKKDTCLGADPKTLGVWQTYPCNNTKTGAAICEMPKRRVCGPKGGMLPITSLSLSPCSLMNLFPQLPAIPYIGQIFEGSPLDSALTSIKNKLTGMVVGLFGGGGDNKDKDDPCKDAGSKVDGSGSSGSGDTKCPMACPPGWFSYSAGTADKCYRLPPPNEAAHTDQFPNWRTRCQGFDSSADVSVINNLVELSVTLGILRQNPKWLVPGSNAHLWLGGYATTDGWKFVDGSDGQLLRALANIAGPPKEGTCLGADFATTGNWRAMPCSTKSGIAFCEMAKKPICGAGDDYYKTKITPATLTPDILRSMFPNMPSSAVPFLGQVLGTEPTDSDIQLDKQIGVNCLRSRGSGAPEKLALNGQVGVKKCGSGYKLPASVYLAAWARCVNLGYEVAMPADVYAPFQSGNWVAEYYREDVSSGGLFGFGKQATYKKVPVASSSGC